jgi:hypothetical protein
MSIYTLHTHNTCSIFRTRSHFGALISKLYILKCILLFCKVIIQCKAVFFYRISASLEQIEYVAKLNTSHVHIFTYTIHTN